MTPVRVLHIVGRMNRAGAETLLMNLYRELDRSRFQFDFVYFSEDRCDFDDEIGALDGRIVRIAGGNSLTRVWRLWSTLRRGTWQIVHAHTLFSSGMFLLAALFANVPMRVAHSHNTDDRNSSSAAGRLYQHVMRWLLSWVATDYVACGRAASEYLFPRRPDVQMIPNAIDIDRFISANGDVCRRVLDLKNPDSLIILQVGRLAPIKNHGFSLKIAAALKAAGVDFQMLFVGTGPDQRSIEGLIGRFDLHGRVRLLGVREDIAELMAAADVLLMPSLHEGFPVVLVESQAAGIPAVIASTISSEVDLGLGLVNFIDLDKPIEGWIAEMLACARVDSIDVEARRGKLEARGFSASAGAARLTSIYVAP